MSDAVLPGDPESPAKFENVEDWVFVGTSGQTAAYTLHVDNGEKASLIHNAIDQTLVEIRLQLKDGTEKNETVGIVNFHVANLFSFSSSKRKAQVFARGESPEEKEFARIAELRAKRAEAFERRQAALEADFLREMAEQGQ